jgi:hypothetical protein
MRIFIIAAALMLMATSAPSQRAPAGRNYRQQFTSLRAQVKAALTKLTSSDDDTNKPTGQDLLELQRLIHRLQESCGQDSVHAKDSRPYLLVGQGCIALDFEVSALSGYIETRDRSFVALARSGDELVKSVEKVL